MFCQIVITQWDCKFGSKKKLRFPQQQSYKNVFLSDLDEQQVPRYGCSWIGNRLCSRETQLLHSSTPRQLPFLWGWQFCPKKGKNMLGSSTDTLTFGFDSFLQKGYICQVFKIFSPYQFLQEMQSCRRKLHRVPLYACKISHNLKSAIYLKLSSNFTWSKLGFRE